MALESVASEVEVSWYDVSKLVIVPTPIGNLGDISQRAVGALAACDIVLCEDSRVCAKLLGHLGLNKRIVVYRDNHEEKEIPMVIDAIGRGMVVCLTSDAGTPTISDPGYRIVNACRKSGLTVEPIPGPCAATTVLSASGLPSDGFLFLGFLPNRSSARLNAFKMYADFYHSIIFYESCHRILKFLEDLDAVVGEGRVVCVAREVTKMHETFHVGELGKILKNVAGSSTKGEFVVVVAPKRFKF
ncbi:MAG: 16S rRNA (cytidine(1402)-2'-O)-methyltransferase [Puniceicoccales bacterium]|jgi:16S rRNA (cytidine1402-2'-O)-methyltransferase|nr:16S rRNA (cytidine(1402)-2'-O)-methyltransferase [Puniceicoccales bacterium]